MPVWQKKEEKKGNKWLSLCASHLTSFIYIKHQKKKKTVIKHNPGMWNGCLDWCFKTNNLFLWLNYLNVFKSENDLFLHQWRVYQVFSFILEFCLLKQSTSQTKMFNMKPKACPLLHLSSMQIITQGLNLRLLSYQSSNKTTGTFASRLCCDSSKVNTEANNWSELRVTSETPLLLKRLNASRNNKKRGWWGKSLNF